MANNSDMIVDLSNYKDRVGDRVMPDKYRVQVEDAEATTANSGNPMINLWLRVVGGEFDGATIVDRLVITEKSLFRVVGFMQAIGLPTPKKRLKVNIQRFIGKVLEVDVEDGDPYNGRIKSEVRGYYRIAKAEQPSDEDGDDLPEPETQDEVDGQDGIPTEETPAEAPAEESKPKAEAQTKKADEDTEDEDDEVNLDALNL